VKYSTKTKALAVFGPLAIAISISSANAQPAPAPAADAQPAAESGPIDPGVYTTIVVHPMAPFRTPNIDPATLDLATLAAVLDPLTPAELLEVRQRCSVVVTDAALYGDPAVAFCTATFTWVAENRPDAPVTDAELAAMPPPAAP
jgi:hypothetical protein